jgi:hypothetical protein
MSNVFWRSVLIIAEPQNQSFAHSVPSAACSVDKDRFARRRESARLDPSLSKWCLLGMTPKLHYYSILEEIARR